MDFLFRRPNGMRGFYVIWSGQMISGIASNITFFALPIWILNMTDISGGALGLWESFYFGSYLIVVLFAGVFIDRYSRKRMMLVYDFLSLSATAILLVLQTTDSMEVWHLYVAAVFQGIGFAFHSPSYSAAITTLVPRKQYVRANGLMSLLYDAPEIFGPVLAGVLYLTIGLSGILALNLLAFVVSIGALLFVEIPPTPHTKEGQMSQENFLTEAIYGIKYILRRPGLLGIQLIFFFGNFFSGIALSVTALFTMILLRSGDASAAGSVQSVGALAAVVAGVFLSTVGGIKKPIRAILIGWVISSLFGLTLLGVGQVFIIWAIAMVINTIFEPVVNVAVETFMQTKIPPDLQGRVFSASDFLSQAMIPITPLLAGFFGEGIFEPAMAEGGPLANIFGWLVGVGPGSGFGLMILLCGIGGTLIGLSGYLIPAIRNVDQFLPDYTPLPPLGMVLRIRPRTEKRNARMIENKRRLKKDLNRTAKDTGDDRIKLDPKE
ncbi:MAG: MFS transporter [Anaerolineae bacterium]|nr:MFS transporter [Anaerolineae bacterium]MCI0607738.1 MFS transporter [Anaerolineae bacterium]